MGYERKRGKLTELNQLILGKEGHDFLAIVGDENIYTSIKFIITLDTDTQLPRDAGWKMVGTLAHPLNAAVFSERRKEWWKVIPFCSHVYQIVYPPTIVLSMQKYTATNQAPTRTPVQYRMCTRTFLGKVLLLEKAFTT
ncbi:MAG: hypothetical protein WDM90_07505 [Ferruginibacter sp.]